MYQSGWDPADRSLLSETPAYPPPKVKPEYVSTPWFEIRVPAGRPALTVASNCRVVVTPSASVPPVLALAPMPSLNVRMPPE